MNAYEVKNTEGLQLNANENPCNLSSEIIAEIKEAIGTVAFHRYPDDQVSVLREAYSAYCKVPSNQILAGNGSDELLGLLINLNLGAGKRLYTLELDFSMYDYYATMQGSEIVRFPFAIEEDFDVEKFIELGKRQAVDMILFSNPNNPTGKAICNEDILKILQAFRDKIVVVDEAYGDFNETSMIEYIDEYPNLLVTRTLSKAFGLAAIRCGFLLGNEALIEKIASYKVPYNVNTLTQVSAAITLRYLPEIEQNIKQMKALRDAMYEQYTQLQLTDVTLYPSKANYFYGTCKDKARLLAVFAEVGINIRNYEGNSFRITVGTKEDNALVLAQLAKL